MSKIEFSVLHINNYRLQCAATWAASTRGCSGAGPLGDSELDAIERACDEGWAYARGAWCCPAHLESLEDGGAHE